MTTTDLQIGSDELTSISTTRYDLIICHDDRIVFHDHYDSAGQRLAMCVALITSSDVLGVLITADRAQRLRQLHQAHIKLRQHEPDTVTNEIAKICREWGVQIYVSTTMKQSTAPRVLYSVITTYGPDQIVAEHFPTKKARRASLIERAGQGFTGPGAIPELMLSDDQRLAALVATLLMPASVTLTESSLDADGGSYRPSGTQLSII